MLLCSTVAEGRTHSGCATAPTQVVCRYRFFKLSRRRGATTFRLRKAHFAIKIVPYYLDRVSLDELSKLLSNPVRTCSILGKTKAFPSRAVRDFSASQVLAAELADAACLIRTPTFCEEARSLASIICQTGEVKPAAKLVRAIFSALTLNDDRAAQLLRTFRARYCKNYPASIDESRRTLHQGKGKRRRTEITQTNCEEDLKQTGKKSCTTINIDMIAGDRLGTPDLTIGI